MGKYSVGITTESKILDSCKALFYQQGVMQTSYEEICAAADINRGLIPYYFKSKNNIATIIFQEYITSADELIREIVGEDVNLIFAVTNALYYDLEKRDPNFCRFYNEIESNSYWADVTLDMQYSVMNKLLLFNGLDIGQDARRTIACMTEGVEKELVHGICSGFLTEDAWSIAVRDSTFFFNLLGLDQSQIRNYMEKSRGFYEKFSLYCGPDFSVSLRSK